MPIGVGYQLVVLGRQRGRLVIGRRHLVLRMPVMIEIARISRAATLQVLVETASWLGLVRILSTFGSAALAGYTIAMRVAIFALLPAFGLSNAAATLVGQNLGAGEPDRAKRSVSTIAFYNVAFLGVISLTFVIAPRALVSLFTTDPAVNAYASECLRIVALGFVAFAYGMVVVQAFNGAGDTKTPMLLNIAVFWCFKIPLAWVLAKVLGLGPTGVFYAISAAYSLQAIVGGALFRRGKWQHAKVA